MPSRVIEERVGRPEGEQVIGHHDIANSRPAETPDRRNTENSITPRGTKGGNIAPVVDPVRGHGRGGAVPPEVDHVVTAMHHDLAPARLDLLRRQIRVNITRLEPAAENDAQHQTVDGRLIRANHGDTLPTSRCPFHVAKASKHGRANRVARPSPDRSSALTPGCLNAPVSNPVPGLVIGAPTTGAGKTTITSGLVRALTATGSVVAPFKVGPDFIDPGFHSLAAGRPSRNLDVFMSGEDLIAPLYRWGSCGADISLIEGLAGLFDGERLEDDRASTAQVARLLGLPVVLVIDATNSGRSLAALVKGFRDFDPGLRLGGVILNRAWSTRSADALTRMLAGIDVTVIGAIPADDAAIADERYLGLSSGLAEPARAEESIAGWADLVAGHIDLAAIRALAMPVSAGPMWRPPKPCTTASIAVATGPAFSFRYEENLDVLRGLGAKVVEFDPLVDPLPEADAIYLCGGFPERFAAPLAANVDARSQIAAATRDGVPTFAECGGLLYLCEDIDGTAMTGVIPYRANLTRHLRIGYVEATIATDSAAGRRGEVQFGQMFHHSRISPTGRTLPPLWNTDGIFAGGDDGVAMGHVAAGYVHTHWARNPSIAATLLNCRT